MNRKIKLNLCRKLSHLNLKIHLFNAQKSAKRVRGSEIDWKIKVDCIQTFAGVTHNFQSYRKKILFYFPAYFLIDKSMFQSFHSHIVYFICLTRTISVSIYWKRGKKMEVIILLKLVSVLAVINFNSKMYWNNE